MRSEGICQRATHTESRTACCKTKSNLSLELEQICKGSSSIADFNDDQVLLEMMQNIGANGICGGVKTSLSAVFSM